MNEYFPINQHEGDAVLLVNLGTPEAPTKKAIRTYLAEFLHDYRIVDRTRWIWCPILHGLILPLRSGPVARKYASIWLDQGSPLMVHSKALTKAVQAEMPQARVELAMRYGSPSVESKLQELQRAGVKRVYVLPLYPQFSHTTTSSVFDAVSWSKTESPKLDLHLLGEYFRHPQWIEAVAQSIRTYRKEHGAGEILLFSFHGIPQRYADAGDPYPEQCVDSARAIAGSLGLKEHQWRMTYQSRFGRQPWLQPYTDKVLQQYGEDGVRRIDVVCPGFAVDCLETLEEIAVENAELFMEAGGKQLNYIPALNDHPLHAQALAQFIKEAQRVDAGS